jgi:hypothetical protein
MHLDTREARIQHIRQGLDRLISADGRRGRLRQLSETNHPMTILTHWQSLYTQGTGLGLEGLRELCERIERVFGAKVEWVTCSELARRHVVSHTQHVFQ